MLIASTSLFSKTPLITKIISKLYRMNFGPKANVPCCHTPQYSKILTMKYVTLINITYHVYFFHLFLLFKLDQIRTKTIRQIYYEQGVNLSTTTQQG